MTPHARSISPRPAEGQRALPKVKRHPLSRRRARVGVSGSVLYLFEGKSRFPPRLVAFRPAHPSGLGQAVP